MIKTRHYYLGERGRVCSASLEEAMRGNFPSMLLKSSSQLSATRFKDGSRLSTVLLSVDHGNYFTEKGLKPVIFETMLFEAGGAVHKYNNTARYISKRDAKRGHRAIRRTLSKYLDGYGKRAY